VPSVTLPKSTLAGAIAICGWTAVANREMVEGELLALLTTEMLPVDVPVTAGEKMTEKETFCPAASVRGKAMLLSVKPAPVSEI
jgi:hypothetical protein